MLFSKKVSYSKAIDYFLMTSLGFIFMSLLEYILVLNTDPRFWTERRREQKSEKMKSLYKVSDTLITFSLWCSNSLQKMWQHWFYPGIKSFLCNLTIWFLWLQSPSIVLVLWKNTASNFPINCDNSKFPKSLRIRKFQPNDHLFASSTLVFWITMQFPLL